MMRNFAQVSIGGISESDERNRRALSNLSASPVNIHRDFNMIMSDDDWAQGSFIKESISNFDSAPSLQNPISIEYPSTLQPSIEALIQRATEDLLVFIESGFLRFKEALDQTLKIFANNTMKEMENPASLSSFAPENQPIQMEVLKERNQKCWEKLIEAKKRAVGQFDQIDNEIRAIIKNHQAQVAGLGQTDLRFNLQGFDKANLKEIKKAQGTSQTCYGTRGIDFSHKKLNTFAVFSENGVLSILDENKHVKGTKYFPCEQRSSNGNSSRDSVIFSPNGSLVALSISNDSVIHIISPKTLRKTYSWDRIKSSKKITRLRWMNNTQIIAAFSEPGIIEFLQIGQKAPLFSIHPDPTKGPQGWIYDIDISSPNPFVYCGGYSSSSFLVFKVTLKESQEAVEWMHLIHKDCVRVVKVANNGKYIFSGGDDRRVVLVSEKTGEVLLNLENALNEYIFGICLSPDDQLVLVQSWFEITIFKWKKENMEKHRLVKVDQLVKGDLGKTKRKFDINSFNVVWDQTKGRESAVLIGLNNGKICKVLMK